MTCRVYLAWEETRAALFGKECGEVFPPVLGRSWNHESITISKAALSEVQDH
jgi:hypothetical protein